MNHIRTAATRLAAGSGRLVCQFFDWLCPGDLREAVQRICWAVFCAFILGSVLVAAPSIMWWLACGWCCAAVYASRPQPTGEGEIEEAGLDVDELVTALHEVADPHVHLVPLAEYLDTTTTVVRTALTEAGIEVAGGVRMEGRGVSTGVRAADIPPLPEGAPSVHDGALTCDNNSNNSDPASPEEGLCVEAIGQSGLIVRDPAEITRRYEVPRTR